MVECYARVRAVIPKPAPERLAVKERDPNSEGLVLAEEVAAILRISRTEVYMLARRRILPCIRLSRKRIRFDLEDVREAIKKLRVSIRTVQ